MIRKLLLALGLVTAVSVMAGAAAVLPIGRSAPLQVIETDTPPVLPTTPPSTTPPSTTPAALAANHKVLVCVMLVDHHGNVTQKPGKNPIEVSANSNNARQAVDPAHPSHFAADGGDCPLPA